MLWSGDGGPQYRSEDPGLHQLGGIAPTRRRERDGRISARRIATATAVDGIEPTVFVTRIGAVLGLISGRRRLSPMRDDLVLGKECRQRLA